MRLLAISLLAILAGILLLAKFRKEAAGKFFSFISWFFIVVGFVLFVGFIGGAIFRLSHRGCMDRPCCRQEMMMDKWHHGMPGGCCPDKMYRGMCPEMKGMPHDSMMMKCCPRHMAGDTTKMPAPKK